MADPTREEVELQWKIAVAILDNLWEAGRSNDHNTLKLLTYLITTVNSDFAPAILQGGYNIRSSLAGIIGQSANLILPHIQSYLNHIYKFYNLSDINIMLDELYNKFIDDSITVKSRKFTFGSPSAGLSNTGNGMLLRLNKDAEGLDIENQFAEEKVAECVSDESSGTSKWEEIFEIKGQSAGIDQLDMICSGMVKRITAKSARNSLLLNPSFSSYAGELTAPTEITDWESNVTVNGTNYEVVESDYYRDFDGDTTPRCLRMKVSSILSQALSLRGIVLDRKTPYLLQIAYKQSADAEGTLKISIGSQILEVPISPEAVPVWQIARLPIDGNLWPDNFVEEDTEVKVEWVKTTGTVLIDDVLLVPFDDFAGGWYILVPEDSSPTPHQIKDTFSFTDSEVGATIQYWLFRAFNRYLPHSETPTFTDPDPYYD